MAAVRPKTPRLTTPKPKERCASGGGQAVTTVTRVVTTPNKDKGKPAHVSVTTRTINAALHQNGHVAWPPTAEPAANAAPDLSDAEVLRHHSAYQLAKAVLPSVAAAAQKRQRAYSAKHYGENRTTKLLKRLTRALWAGDMVLRSTLERYHLNLSELGYEPIEKEAQDKARLHFAFLKADKHTPVHADYPNAEALYKALLTQHRIAGRNINWQEMTDKQKQRYFPKKRPPMTLTAGMQCTAADGTRFTLVPDGGMGIGGGGGGGNGGAGAPLVNDDDREVDLDSPRSTVAEVGRPPARIQGGIQSCRVWLEGDAIDADGMNEDELLEDQVDEQEQLVFDERRGYVGNLTQLGCGVGMQRWIKAHLAPYAVKLFTAAAEHWLPDLDLPMTIRETMFTFDDPTKIQGETAIYEKDMYHYARVLGGEHAFDALGPGTCSVNNDGPIGRAKDHGKCPPPSTQEGKMAVAFFEKVYKRMHSNEGMFTQWQKQYYSRKYNMADPNDARDYMNILEKEWYFRALWYTQANNKRGAGANRTLNDKTCWVYVQLIPDLKRCLCVGKDAQGQQLYDFTLLRCPLFALTRILEKNTSFRHQDAANVANYVSRLHAFLTNIMPGLAKFIGVNNLQLYDDIWRLFQMQGTMQTLEYNLQPPAIRWDTYVRQVHACRQHARHAAMAGHILAELYAQYTVRDDYGQLTVVQTTDALEILDVWTDLMKDPIMNSRLTRNGDKRNYYVVEAGQIILNSYKTVNNYGQQVMQLDAAVRQQINNYMASPPYQGYLRRIGGTTETQYLFDPIGLSKDKQGHYKLSGKRLFGKWLANVGITAEDGMELNIRDLRRARATFFAMAPAQIRHLNARNELHSAKVEEMVYTHVEENVTKLLTKKELEAQFKALITYLPEDKHETAKLYLQAWHATYNEVNAQHVGKDETEHTQLVNKLKAYYTTNNYKDQLHTLDVLTQHTSGRPKRPQHGAKKQPPILPLDDHESVSEEEEEDRWPEEEPTITPAPPMLQSNGKGPLNVLPPPPLVPDTTLSHTKTKSRSHDRSERLDERAKKRVHFADDMFEQVGPKYNINESRSTEGKVCDAGGFHLTAEGTRSAKEKRSQIDCLQRRQCDAQGNLMLAEVQSRQLKNTPHADLQHPTQIDEANMALHGGAPHVLCLERRPQDTEAYLMTADGSQRDAMFAHQPATTILKDKWDGMRALKDGHNPAIVSPHNANQFIPPIKRAIVPPHTILLPPP